MPMKAPTAQAAAEAAFAPGCPFKIFWGLEIKIHFKKTRVLAGSRCSHLEYLTSHFRGEYSIFLCEPNVHQDTFGAARRTTPFDRETGGKMIYGLQKNRSEFCY
jgi:hypothetical protein